MGIKVIHYKNGFFHFWVHDINKAFYFFCPGNCSPVLPDTDMMLPSKRFYESKDAACTITDIFGIYFPVIARAHWQRFPCLSQQLVWFFIHADDRMHWVIREFIDIENIFHTCYEFCILFWRDAPIVIEVRSKFIFFNTLRIVSLLTGVSSSIRAFSSRSRSVLRECPSGAGPQAI